ncbi:transporter substrate-binding domain-containing protein [Niveibacterium sp. 24ML]|uniref:substrate-binding periplasmic protein n=1 Tax=Niveibacterium sp. 24ML TaxID=2985512 RepID=UPI002271CF5E|nr:transporter substrate-binding domain-containing protein [Niveibacterium sp. 24ML]MCX9158411.1 transporter substrate-binding domain-containing protein [Niveibacterium sp. 24ML]
MNALQTFPRRCASQMPETRQGAPAQSLCFAKGIGRTAISRALCGAAAALFTAYAPAGQPFHYLAHELPPFAFQDNGRVVGFAVDLLADFCSNEGLCADTDLFPFKRAFVQVGQQGPANSFLMLARCAERERDFKWVGPIFESQVVFFTRRDSPVSAKSLEDLRTASIGVHRGNRDHSFLLAQGFTQLNTSDTQVQTLKMLAAGRIDATPMSEAVFPYAAREAGLDPGLFVATSVRLYSSVLYFGFSLSTPNSEIDRWEHALLVAKTTGRYHTLYRRYFP